MKRIFIALAAGIMASQAIAADSLESRLTPNTQGSYGADAVDSIDDVEPPEIEVEPAVDWDGWYIGGSIGWGAALTYNESLSSSTFSGSSLSDEFPDWDGSGLMLGGFAGVNRQISGNWVIGLEAGYYRPDFGTETSISDEFLFEDLSDTIADALGGVGLTVDDYDAEASITHYNDLNWMATLTPRIGYLIQPETMIYAKGGLAYADFSTGWVTTVSASSSLAGVDQSLTASQSVSDDSDSWGYTVGAGVEHMVTERLFIGLEYSYSQFDVNASYNQTHLSAEAWGDVINESFNDTVDLGDTYEFDSKFGIHTVMGRVGLRF